MGEPLPTAYCRRYAGPPHIVSDQPVTALNKFKRCFRFADAALAHQQHTEPEHINQRTVNGYSRCMRFFNNMRNRLISLVV